MAPQNGWFYLRTIEVRLIHIPVAMSWWRLRMVQDSSTCMRPKWDIATIIVCTHPSPFLLVGVEPPTKFRKGGGLDRISILRGGCWEDGSDFFREGWGLQLFHKSFSSGGLLKNLIFRRGGVFEKPIYRAELPKKEGTRTVSRFKGGGELGKKEGGWYPNAHYVQCHMLGSLSLIISFKQSFVRLKSGFCYAGFTDFESLRQSLSNCWK